MVITVLGSVIYKKQRRTRNIIHLFSIFISSSMPISGHLRDSIVDIYKMMHPTVPKCFLDSNN